MTTRLLAEGGRRQIAGAALTVIARDRPGHRRQAAPRHVLD